MANIKSDEYEIYSVGLKGLYVVARLFVNLSEQKGRWGLGRTIAGNFKTKLAF